MQTTKSQFGGLIAATMIGVFVLAGCSDGDNGGPFNPPGQTGQPPGSTTASTGDPSVPTVANPLNADPFVDRPCDLVDEQTVTEIGEMKPPEEDTTSESAKRLVGPNCTWFPKERGPDIGLQIHTVHREHGKGGIDAVYAGHRGGLTDYLEPVEIPGHPGYPAVFAGQASDKEPGHCPMYLGVANDLVIALSVTDLDGTMQDTCPATLKVAASVLQTLKAGS